MKIQSKQNKKYVPIIAIVGIAILIIFIVIFFIFRHTNETTVTTPSKTQETQNDLDAKQNLIDNPNSQDAPVNKESGGDSITITSSQATENVTIFTKLINVASGSCDLKITNGEKSYTSTVPVIYQSQFSSCAGFTVPKDKLSTGTWNVTLNVNNNEKTVTKTATIEVN